jgi:hypothetical protein
MSDYDDIWDQREEIIEGGRKRFRGGCKPMIRAYRNAVVMVRI